MNLFLSPQLIETSGTIICPKILPKGVIKTTTGENIIRYVVKSRIGLPNRRWDEIWARSSYNSNSSIWLGDWMHFYSEDKDTENKKNILLAPSWGKNSITNTVADQLIKVLLKKKYKVFFRPHPHSFKVDKKVTLQLIKNFQKKKDFYLIDNINEIYDFKKCSIMITDYSSVAFDFSFAFLKPLIFINLPQKINNEAYKLFKIKPKCCFKILNMAASIAIIAG